MMPAKANAMTPPGAPPLPEAKEYSKSLKWSLLAHLGLLLAVVIKSVVFPSKPILYIPTLRVDIVGLPDVLKKDLAQQAKLPATSPAVTKALEEAEKAEKEQARHKTKSSPVKETAKDDEMVLRPKAKAGANLVRKNLSALERIKALEKIKGEEERTGRSTLIKGNIISKGTSLSGDARESQEPSYYDLLRDRLHENWALPRYLISQNLSAQVRLFLDAHGHVRQVRFERSSGNARFDEEVKRTIEESDPFSPPPKSYQSSLLVDGVLVGFPL